MTLLKILGIDRYTAKFKEWIRNKFIAKGGLKTINNESIEGKGNIEVQANAEIILPESIELTNVKKTSESRVFRAFYNIQTDEFIINGNGKMESLHVWLLNRGASLGQILNITVVDEYSWLYHCVAKVILNPIINVQFDYLDIHYTLTWNADTISWDVTKTPINTGAGIDPVVWKYMCEPYIVEDRISLPKELINIIVGNYGSIKYLKRIAPKVLQIVDYDGHAHSITSMSDNMIYSSFANYVYNSEEGWFEEEH